MNPRISNPLQFSIYKGTGGKFGALQFNFQPSHFYNGRQKSFDAKDYSGNSIFEEVEGKYRLKTGWKEREGAIFLEITSAKDKNVYDWDNKIIIALSVIDMGKMLLGLATGNECNIVHDPGAKTENAGAIKKYINITSPKGTVEGAVFNVTQQSGGQSKKHMVPITGDEVIVLRQLLQTAISRALNW